MYAEARGWEVVTVYDLAGVSGKSVSDHPEARRMLADVKASKIEALIFSKLARLARNTRELLDFVDYFRDHGANLVSLQEAIDTSTPRAWHFYTAGAAMALREREETSDRVKASVRVRPELGKKVGGEAPSAAGGSMRRGFRLDRGGRPATHVPCPSESAGRSRLSAGGSRKV